MAGQRKFVVWLSVLVLEVAVPRAQAGTIYTSAAAFAAATTAPTLIGFDGILTSGESFAGFNPLLVDGDSFSTPNPATAVNVTAKDFYSPTDYPADFIIDSSNPGPNNTLDITLAAPVHALALVYGGFGGGNAGTITLSDGEVFTNPSLPSLGSTDFVGVVSPSPITSLSFVTTDDSWTLLDLITASPIPEPESILLFGTTILVLTLSIKMRDRKRRG